MLAVAQLFLLAKCFPLKQGFSKKKKNFSIHINLLFYTSEAFSNSNKLWECAGPPSPPPQPSYTHHIRVHTIVYSSYIHVGVERISINTRPQPLVCFSRRTRAILFSYIYVEHTNFPILGTLNETNLDVRCVCVRCGVYIYRLFCCSNSSSMCESLCALVANNKKFWCTSGAAAVASTWRCTALLLHTKIYREF